MFPLGPVTFLFTNCKLSHLNWIQQVFLSFSRKMSEPSTNQLIIDTGTDLVGVIENKTKEQKPTELKMW